VGSSPWIADNLRQIRERIARAAERSGRSPAEIRLVAVAKGQPPERVREAVAAGVTELGENYVQEAEAVFALLAGMPVTRHFIGHLQRNKAARAVRLFDLIQTVDDVGLARTLSRRAQETGRTLPVLLEVNAAEVPGRFGLRPELCRETAEEVSELPALRLLGLMGIAPGSPEAPADEVAVRACFAKLRALFDQLPAGNRQVLSMGMTGDFEAAIEEGSTMVRIGTGVFGPRRTRG
jgi:hypothetical protein